MVRCARRANCWCSSRTIEEWLRVRVDRVGEGDVQWSFLGTSMATLYRRRLSRSPPCEHIGFEPSHGSSGIRMLRGCTRSPIPPRVAIVGCCHESAGWDRYNFVQTKTPYRVRRLCCCVCHQRGCRLFSRCPCSFEAPWKPPLPAHRPAFGVVASRESGPETHFDMYSLERGRQPAIVYVWRFFRLEVGCFSSVAGR